MIRPPRCLGVLVLGTLVVSLATSLPYPEIQRLSSQDPLFRQQQDLVDWAQAALVRGEAPGDLALFSYRPRAEDTLFSLAAAFNLPYEALSTLNGLRHPGALRVGEPLAVPSQPGLFLALDHPGEIDRLIASRGPDLGPGQRLRLVRGGSPETMNFYYGARFHPLERAFFLGILFQFPLPQGRLTSAFGPRTNPFTGHPGFHAGIDLAAPVGTPVSAAREGRVTATGNDRVLGLYVRLDHGDGYQTVYGHLSQVAVTLHQSVAGGTILGNVGSTGQSTGPHLHFEIRRQGSAEDPVPLLPSILR